MCCLLNDTACWYWTGLLPIYHCFLSRTYLLPDQGHHSEHLNTAKQPKTNRVVLLTTHLIVMMQDFASTINYFAGMEQQIETIPEDGEISNSGTHY